MFISHRYKTIFVHIQRTGGNSIQKIFEEADPELVDTIPVDPAKKRTKHCFAVDIQESIEPAIFKEYTKFAVVRNPFDRLVSWYLMFRRGLVQGDRMMKLEDKSRSTKLYFDGLRVLNSLKSSQKTWMIQGWNRLFHLFDYSENSKEQSAAQFAQTGSNIMLAILRDANTFDEFVTLPKGHADGLFERFYVNQLDYITHNDNLLVDRVLRVESLASEFGDLAAEIGLDGELVRINETTRQTGYRDYYTDETQQAVLERFRRDLDYFGYTF